MLGFIIVAGLWGFGNFGHFLSYGPTSGTSTPAVTNRILLETGDAILTETGDYLLIE